MRANRLTPMPLVFVYVYVYVYEANVQCRLIGNCLDRDVYRYCHDKSSVRRLRATQTHTESIKRCAFCRRNVIHVIINKILLLYY